MSLPLLLSFHLLVLSEQRYHASLFIFLSFPLFSKLLLGWCFSFSHGEKGEHKMGKRSIDRSEVRLVRVFGRVEVERETETWCASETRIRLVEEDGEWKR